METEQINVLYFLNNRIDRKSLWSLVGISFFALSCSKPQDDTVNSGQQVRPPFEQVESFAGFTNMATFRAIATQKWIYKHDDGVSIAATVTFLTQEKTNFSVGDVNAPRLEVDFLNSVEIGREYILPDAFLEWAKKRK